MVTLGKPTPRRANMGSGVRTAAVVLLQITVVLTLVSLLVGLLTLIVGIVAGLTDRVPILVQTYPPRVLTEKELVDWV